MWGDGGGELVEWHVGQEKRGRCPRESRDRGIRKKDRERQASVDLTGGESVKA